MTTSDPVRAFLTAPFDEIHGSDSAITTAEPFRGTGVTLLFFSLGRSLFALPATTIKAVLESSQAITVPFVRHHLCRGFIQLQGSPVPLLNLRALLRLPPAECCANGRTILMQFDGLLTAFDVDVISAVSTTEIREAGSLQLDHRTVVHRLTTFHGAPATVLEARDLSEAVQGGNL